MMLRTKSKVIPRRKESPRQLARNAVAPRNLNEIEAMMNRRKKSE